jgi:hypothetical protein
MHDVAAVLARVLSGGRRADAHRAERMRAGRGSASIDLAWDDVCYRTALGRIAARLLFSQLHGETGPTRRVVIPTLRLERPPCR